MDGMIAEPPLLIKIHTARDRLKQDREEIDREKKRLSQEMKRLSQEMKRLSQETKRLSREMKDLTARRKGIDRLDSALFLVGVGSKQRFWCYLPELFN